MSGPCATRLSLLAPVALVEGSQEPQVAEEVTKAVQLLGGVRAARVGLVDFAVGPDTDPVARPNLFAGDEATDHCSLRCGGASSSQGRARMASGTAISC